MNRMGCGCDSMGCSCDSLGCGCDSLGCGCKDKTMLGQIEKATGMNPWWFLIGAGVGAGLWYVLTKKPTPTPAGQESIAPVPTIAPPSRFADLQSVANRLDQLKTLYRMDKVTVEQALAETDGLLQAANNFSLQEGERVPEVVSAIMSFQDELRDFIQFKKDNPEITKRVPQGPVTTQPPVIG